MTAALRLHALPALLLLLAACDTTPAPEPPPPPLAPGTFEATVGPVAVAGGARVVDAFYQDGFRRAVFLEPVATSDRRARGLEVMNLLAPGQRMPAPGTYPIDHLNAGAFGLFVRLFDPQTPGAVAARSGTLVIEISTDSSLVGHFSAEVPAPLDTTVEGRFHARVSE